MKLLTILGLVFVAGPVLHAQATGTNLTVDVTIKSIAVRGDTMGLTYVVLNKATSRDPLLRFAVDAPAGVKSIPLPQPATSYFVLGTYQGRPMAEWMFLDFLAPGATSIPVYFESVGLPAIATHWAGGDDPPVDESVADSTSEDPLKYHAVAGKTVGVEPWPVDKSAKALIARLKTLTQTSCATPLKWITASSLCTKLLGYLTTAETNRAAGKVTLAKSSMATYIKSLAGKTAGTFATGVTSPAYWLLKTNADIVVSKL
jgi:hypothetical protein